MFVAFSDTVGLFIEMVLGGLSVKGQCKPSSLVSYLSFIRSTQYDNKVNHTLWQACDLGPCETFRAMPLNSALPPLCLNFL